VLRVKIKTDGSRPVRRHTFYNAKKVCKKAYLLRRALLAPVVGVLFSDKVDEHMSAAWHRKPIPAFLNHSNKK
jgi:hypothetical protein